MTTCRPTRGPLPGRPRGPLPDGPMQRLKFGMLKIIV